MISSRDPDALFSGGGISFLAGNRAVKFSYGYSSLKGKRATMEDFFETRISDVDGQMVAFFAVFDGHGGARTAEYLKNNLFNNLVTHYEFISDTKKAIGQVFKQTDEEYLTEERGQPKNAGSTASTALLVGDKLIVANVGDSRVVASRMAQLFHFLMITNLIDQMSDRGLKMLVASSSGLEHGELVEFLRCPGRLETSNLSHM